MSLLVVGLNVHGPHNCVAGQAISYDWKPDLAALTEPQEPGQDDREWHDMRNADEDATMAYWTEHPSTLTEPEQAR
jgi:hypothetical protein